MGPGRDRAHQERRTTTPAAPAAKSRPHGAAGDSPILALQRKVGNQATADLLEDERDRESSTAPGAEPPQIVYDVLSQPGAPLDASVRGTMESRFGADFGSVRLHTDARAQDSAAAVGARAYTVGRDVVFGAPGFNANDPSSVGTLAHELTHTVQNRASPWQGERLELDSPHTEEEREAASAGATVSEDSSREQAETRATSVPDSARSRSRDVRRQPASAVAEHVADKRPEQEASVPFEREVPVQTLPSSLGKITVTLGGAIKVNGFVGWVEDPERFHREKQETQAESHEERERGEIGKTETELKAGASGLRGRFSEIEFSHAVATEWGKVKLGIGAKPGQVSSVSLAWGPPYKLIPIEDFEIKAAAHADLTKPVEIAFEKGIDLVDTVIGHFRFKGKLAASISVFLAPNWTGLAAEAAEKLAEGAAEEGEVVVGVSAGAVGAAAVVTAAYLAWVGWGFYELGKAHERGRTEAMGYAFLNGYTRTLTDITAGRRLALGTEQLGDLATTDWPSDLLEAVQTYVHAEGLDLRSGGRAERAGQAAALQAVLATVSDAAGLRSLAAQHRRKYGESDIERRNKYFYMLYPLVHEGRLPEVFELVRQLPRMV